MPERQVTIIGAATSAGSHHAGQDRAPAALRAAGFITRLNYQASPAGANVPCTLSAAHPYPVVLVEGTLAKTGASKVDLAGWSQGGMMPRYYINNLGGASKVNMLVGLAPSNYGTTLNGLATLVAELGLLGLATALLSLTCKACVQQIQGSSFLTSLNQTPTVPGVKYVVIETADDDAVTPYTNAFLPAAPNVQNITLQSQCGQDASDHLSIGYDSNALQDMINALGPDNPGFQPAVSGQRRGPVPRAGSRYQRRATPTRHWNERRSLGTSSGEAGRQSGT